MAAENEKFVQEIQESILEGLSENLRKEVLTPHNIGKLGSPDSYVSVTGVCGDTIEMYLKINTNLFFFIQVYTLCRYLTSLITAKF